MKKILTILLSLFLLVGCTGDTKKSIPGHAILRFSTSILKKQEDVQKEEKETPDNKTNTTNETDTSSQTPPSDTEDTSTVQANSAKEEVKKQDTAASNPALPPETTAPVTPPVEKPVEPVPEKQYVMVSIDCKTILKNRDAFKEKYKSFIPSNGILLAQTKVEYESGDTALTVFKKVTKEKGIAIINQNGYISSIGHISERGMEDGTGGWMYLVNGSVASVGASSYKLSANDTIQWRYTCIPGDV